MGPKDWQQTEATVQTSSREHCRLASGGGFAGKEYMISFNYEVNGRRYLSEFESPDPWEIGSKFCIQYDPDEPERNTMCDRKQARWVYIAMAIVAVLAILTYLWIASRHAR
jgi:hypothetical protein